MNRFTLAAALTIFACDQVNAPPVDELCPGQAACHAQGGAPREPTSGAGAGGDGAPSGGVATGGDGVSAGGVTATSGSGAGAPDCPVGVCSGASGGAESFGESGGSSTGGSFDGGNSAGASEAATGGAVSAGAGGVGGAGGDTGATPVDTSCKPDSAEAGLVCFPPSSDTSYPFMMSGLRFKYPNTSDTTRSLDVAAINSHGVAVGTRFTCRGDPQPPLEPNPQIWRAFSYADGVITLLSDENSRATAINDKGTILGVIGGLPTIWRNGETIPLGSWGGEAIAINEHDQVLLRNGQRGSLWTDGVEKMIDDVYVLDLNDVGEVVGVDFRIGLGRAFVWKDGVFHDLPPLDGDTYSLAEAINDKGQVVGSSDRHAVIWENRIPRLLSLGPIDPEGWGSTAADINNAGSIVGAKSGLGTFLYSSGAVTRVGSVFDNLHINDNGVIVGANYIWSPSCYDICCNVAAGP